MASGPPNPNDPKYKNSGSKSKSKSKSPLGVQGSLDTSTGEYSGYVATGPNAVPWEGNTANPVPQGGQFDVPGYGAPGTAPNNGAIPRYYAGDQYQIYNMSQRDLISLQQAMQAAGYYPSGTQIQQGYVGAADLKAFQTLLEQSNRNGTDFDTELMNGVKYQQSQKAQSPKSQLLIHLTDPADITAALQKSALTLYGGYLPQDQVDRFVQAYQQTERDQQTAIYNAQNNGVGGDVALNPATGTAHDINVDAANFIKTNFPGQVAGTAVGENFDKWNQALTSSGGPGGETQADH